MLLINAESNYVNFALFVSFFPQLVAGPIEKASSLLPQFKRAAEWRYDDQVQGLRRILWGLLKKVVIADPCGAMVSHYMPSASSSAIAATLTTILFSVQIYCDFSGYCDIAIGCHGSEIMYIFLSGGRAEATCGRSLISLQYSFYPVSGMAQRCTLWHGVYTGAF